MPNYMVSVSYDGKKIVPGPFVALTRDIQRSADGTARNYGWKIVVKGKVAAWMGSPDNTGTFWQGSGYPPDPSILDAAPEKRIANIKKKLGAISELFSEDGHWFEIQPADGSAPIKFKPRINSIEFAEGKWFDYVDFTISMETECILFGNVQDPKCPFDPANNPAEETWSIEPADDFRPTWRVTHSVSATSKTKYDDDGTGEIEKEGWELAQESVMEAIGFDSDIIQTAFGVDVAYTEYNHNVQQQLDKAGGKYSYTESWVLSTTNYTEDIQVDHSFSSENGFDTVKVQATITGLQEGSDTTTRFTNANARAEIFLDQIALVAQEISGITVNPLALNLSVARNKPQGVVTCTGEFNTRPAVPNGLLSKMLTVTLDHAVPIVAQLGVINRIYGPVLQPIGSKTQQSCTIQVDLAVQVRYGVAYPPPPTYDTNADFVRFCGNPPTVYVSSDKEVWNEQTGRYSRTVSYIYQQV